MLMLHVKRIRIVLFYLPLLAGILLYACQSDLFDAKDHQPVQEEPIDAAKRLYSSAARGEIMQLRSAVSANMQVKPVWDILHTEENEQYYVLEIALASEYLFNFATVASVAKAEKTEDNRYLLSKTSFIYIRHKEDNREAMFMMTIVPDLCYLEQTGFRPFDRMSYLHRDEAFRGLIFYQTLSGEYIRGFRYGDQVADATAVDDPLPVTRFSCTWEEVTKTEWHCYSWVTSGSNPQIGITCHKHEVHSHNVHMCVDPADGGNWMDDGFGGGGILSPPPPPPVPLATRLANVAQKYITDRDQRRYGGSPPNVDCSMLTQEIAKKEGKTIPRTTTEQTKWFKDNGTFVTKVSDVRVGDFMFWTNPNHVAVVVQVHPEIKIVHATVNGNRNGSIKDAFVNSEGKINDGRGWPHKFVGAGRFN